MTIDLAGIALIITAFGAVVGPAVTAYLQLKAARKAEVNKQEAIIARTAQTDQIAAVHTLVNSRSEQQDRKIEGLKTEIVRLNIPGASPTSVKTKEALEAEPNTVPSVVTPIEPV